MKERIRWLLVLPSVAITAAATLFIYWPLRWLLLMACPKNKIETIATTDISKSDFAASYVGCAAGWYPGAELALIVFVLALCIVVCSVTSHFFAPARKRMTAIVTGLFAVAIMGFMFLKA